MYDTIYINWPKVLEKDTLTYSVRIVQTSDTTDCEMSETLEYLKCWYNGQE